MPPFHYSFHAIPDLGHDWGGLEEEDEGEQERMKDGGLGSGWDKKTQKLTFGWVWVVLMMRYDGRAVQNEDTSRRWKHDSVCLIPTLYFLGEKQKKDTHPQNKAPEG